MVQVGSVFVKARRPFQVVLKGHHVKGRRWGPVLTAMDPKRVHTQST